MAAPPWYRSLFGEDYLRVWAPALPPERTEREVEGIADLLALPPGSAILDLCCGHGRHAIPLAARGFAVTGQDLSPVFLARARSEAERQGAAVRWVESDMRAIPFRDEFDAVINIFTAFGYLESEEEDLEVLQQVHRALRPGGSFLIETLHRDGLMRRFAPHSVQRLDGGTLVLEERSFDSRSGRNETRMTLIEPDGSRKELGFSLRLYAVTELERLLGAAGLQVEAVYGALDRSNLTLESRRLVLLCRKPAAG